jgi:hypothetical protein
MILLFLNISFQGNFNNWIPDYDLGNDCHSFEGWNRQ